MVRNGERKKIYELEQKINGRTFASRKVMI